MSETVPQVIVLGGGLEPNGSPLLETQERAETAYILYDELGLDKVIFSGGYSFFAPERLQQSSEAQIMATIAVDKGVPEAIVAIEELSTSTMTNFIFSAGLVDAEKNLGVLTHDWHLPRALYIAGRVLTTPVVGIEAITEQPKTPDGPEKRRITAAKLLMAGIARGDIDKIYSRQKLVERTATKLSGSLRTSLYREHPGVA